MRSLDSIHSVAASASQGKCKSGQFLTSDWASFVQSLPLLLFHALGALSQKAISRKSLVTTAFFQDSQSVLGRRSYDRAIGSKTVQPKMSARNLLSIWVSGILFFAVNISAEDSVRASTAFAGWLEGIVRVDAVLYDCEASPIPRLLSDGKFHQGLVEQETKSLSETQIEDLERFVTNDERHEGEAGCYIPHHGFVFYGKDERILGYIEVCLMCGRGHINPKGDLSEDSLWNLEGIRALIDELGMPAFDKRDDWDAYFAAIKRVDKSGKR